MWTTAATGNSRTGSWFRAGSLNPYTCLHTLQSLSHQSWCSKVSCLGTGPSQPGLLNTRYNLSCWHDAQIKTQR